ncbi:hypothetical protein [Enterococcus ratti]|uniref:Uncharacterized protein n=1 Tax=Enterococcus ratti TaxID=150033 RepID=A0A1L8WNV0_9ENTE|nr:hypothetical protein [Enterococcus ratti]OJG82676.1 hypothetical protein RV14_GL002251 [Enterococcus ratti]
MNIKKLSLLSVTIFILTAVSVLPVVKLSEDVFADETTTKVTASNSLHQSKLFKHVIAQKVLQTNVNVFYDGATKISQLLDKNMNVLAAEISNSKTLETIAVTKTDTEVIVEKTTKGYNGEYKVKTEHFPLATIKESENIGINPMNHYTA